MRSFSHRDGKLRERYLQHFPCKHRQQARPAQLCTRNVTSNGGAREHFPELADASDLDDPTATLAFLRQHNLPHGKSLSKLADAMEMPADRAPKLSHRQTQTQRLIGCLKFIEKVHPRLSLVLHRLSCVMSCPPPEAWDVARAALVSVWRHRFVGLTFGGSSSPSPRLGGDLRAAIDLTEPAPHQLEAHGDATWGDRNLYGLILTYHGAAIYHQTKKIALIVDSSMEAESLASAKAGECVAYAREIFRAFGVPDENPTLISTDNVANQLVASGTGSPSRSRHFLRRYFALKQRIRSGEVVVKHVDDPNMPADFLTKWIPSAKLETSLIYATNPRAAAACGHAALAYRAYTSDEDPTWGECR